MHGAHAERTPSVVLASPRIYTYHIHPREKTKKIWPHPETLDVEATYFENEMASDHPAPENILKGEGYDPRKSDSTTPLSNSENVLTRSH